MSTFNIMSMVMSILHVSDLPTFHTHDAATALQRVVAGASMPHVL